MNKASKEQAEPTYPWKWILGIVATVIGGLVLLFADVIRDKATEDKYGRLAIECNVDSALVCLNNEFLGYAQADSTVIYSSREPGTYILLISKAGYNEYEKNIKITAGELATEKIDLTKEDAAGPITPPQRPRVGTEYHSITITVQKEFENAKILIDGDWVANAPGEIMVSEGRHLLRIEKNGFFYQEMIQVPSRNLINIMNAEFSRMDVK
jgi:hypothetical protein